MRKFYALFPKSIFLLILSCTALYTATSFAKINPFVDEAKAKGWLYKQHLGFIENKGQVFDQNHKPVKNVLFRTSIKNADVYITTSGITYLLKKPLNDRGEEKEDDDKNTKRKVQWCRMDMELLNASIVSENISPEEPEHNGVLNYYLASCPHGVLGVKTYDKVIIKNIYPGIDWVIYSNANGLKYNFVVHAGANPGDIKWNYAGDDGIDTSTDGSRLTLKTSLGDIQEGALNCYQGSPSHKISSKYKLTGKVLSFGMGMYDTHKDLIIDPPIDILKWATYYGPSNAFEHIGPRAICTDSAGNVYITGYTDATTFPLMDPGGGAYYNGVWAGGSYMAFIIKFNYAGVRLWATYYGGSFYEYGMGIATDGNGNVFLGGFTGSADLPTKNPGGGAYYNGTFNNYFDLFFCKFSPVGALIWGTYYGGSLDDEVRGIAVDASGNLWATGYSTSSDFPTFNMPGAYNQAVWAGGPNNGDAFIIKFTNSCQLLWATYYGGGSDDEGYSIKLAKSGDIVMAGYTSSTNFPTLSSPGAYFQATNGGGKDMFISKFSNAGVQLWSTYYGGSGDDWSTSDGHTNGTVGLDIKDNIYVTAATNSTNFPVHNAGGGAYFKATNSGGNDAFILKFRPSGARVWATYYGGSSDDEGNSVVTDANGILYFTGQSASAAIPTLNPGGGAFYQSTNGGGITDIFINEFDSTGVHFWGTFFGGNGEDWSTQATVNPFGCLLITGEWKSSSGITAVNPGGGAFFQSSYTGTDDGFMMDFCSSCAAPVVGVVPALDSVCPGDSILMHGTGATSYSWKPKTNISCFVCDYAYATPTVTTTYTVTGSNGFGCVDSAMVTIKVKAAPNLNVVPTLDSVCLGDSIALSATGAPSYTWKPSAGLSCTSCPNPYAKPLVTTTYTVIGASGNACKDSMMVTIKVSPPPNVIITPSFDSLCMGDSVKLTASGASTFKWAPSTGLSCTTCPNPMAKPATTTTYTVIGTSGSCTDTTPVTITVSPAPAVQVSPASAKICAGDSASLTASGATTYTWKPATGLSCNNCPNPWVKPGATTTYTVTGTSAGCKDSTSVTVTLNPPPVVTVSPSVSISQGSNTTLTATGGGTYLWTPATGLSCTNCATTIATPTVTTSYCVLVTDNNGCVDSNCVTVTVEGAPCGELFMPNAFSPNETNNNILYAKGNCITSFSLTIYDRWGNQVFQSLNINDGWDGKYKGKPMEAGTYVYYLDATDTQGKVTKKKGDVALVR